MENLRQAKVHNRAIAVTDIAIGKVPLIKIDGFTDEENQIIQSLHKHLLKLVQEKCKEFKVNDYEYAIAVDIHENKR